MYKPSYREPKPAENWQIRIYLLSPFSCLIEQVMYFCNPTEYIILSKLRRTLALKVLERKENKFMYLK